MTENTTNTPPVPSSDGKHALFILRSPDPCLRGFQRETRYALNMDSMSGVHATCLFCMWTLSKEFGGFFGPHK